MKTIQGTAAENHSQAFHMPCVTASIHLEIIRITGDYQRLLEITRNYWRLQRAPAPSKDCPLFFGWCPHRTCCCGWSSRMAH